MQYFVVYQASRSVRLSCFRPHHPPVELASYCRSSLQDSLPFVGNRLRPVKRIVVPKIWHKVFGFDL